MMFWTVRQEEVMRENCFRGAKAVQEALLRECGVRRSIRAIEMHASRLHMSLKVRAACPECGRIGVHLNRQSGMCARCTEFMHVEEERAFNELLQAEAEDAENGRLIEELRREYAALRQRNSRLCRKHGLLPKSKRAM
ncbi:hypothetical protein GMI70_05330 [Eggerthellaceae bacterium zg-893]|nr:hypothetical protein [Eggerthellaceae bacterium zg-893]